jgi:hypothetical protein
MLNLKMLQKKVRDRIRHEKLLRTKHAQDVYKKTDKRTAGRIRGRYQTVRNRASRAIQDLTFLIENLPEKQVEQIFNDANMKPFLTALLSLESEDKKRRRKRVLSLWRLILFQQLDYIQELVGSNETYNALIIPVDTSIKAIAYAAMFQTA